MMTNWTSMTNSSIFSILTYCYLVPVAGALVCFLLPRAVDGVAKWIALLASVGSFASAIAAFASYDRSLAGLQFITRVPWIEELGVTYWTGADGISLSLLLLNGVVGAAGVLFSWNVRERAGFFFGLYLLVVAGAAGVFQSLDLFVLFVFYELVIVPKYLLIAGWGSTRRDYGAMKLTMYSVAGSALVLVGMVWLWAVGASRGQMTMGLPEMLPGLWAEGWLTKAEQVWLFPVMFLGFAVLGGLWPLHTWAPTGHVAAPTAGSMLLAGVVMKLGAYAALRVPMALMPEGLEVWRGVFAVLGAVGIVAGALAAMQQQDLKFVVGYSSIAHMGFVLLGLMTLDLVGLSGAVFQMVSHGIIGGLLFAVVGRMVYERTHTRDLAELEGMGLSRRLPVAAGVFVLASLASMGMPGFSGFVAEVCVLVGAWRTMPGLMVVAVVGAAMTVAFTLGAMRRAFFGQAAGGGAGASGEGGAMEPMEPVSAAEVVGAVVLIAAMLGLGVAPMVLLEPIGEALQGDYFHGLIQLVQEVMR